MAEANVQELLELFFSHLQNEETKSQGSFPEVQASLLALKDKRRRPLSLVLVQKATWQCSSLAVRTGTSVPCHPTRDTLSSLWEEILSYHTNELSQRRGEMKQKVIHHVRSTH